MLTEISRVRWAWSMNYVLQPPTLPRNPASLGCCAVCHVPCGGISCLAWRHSWKKKNNLTQVSLFKFIQPLLCPGKNELAPKEGVNGWVWTYAPCWVLPPRRHILEVCSASLLCQRRKLPLGSLAQVTSICQTVQMCFVSTNNFWEFISVVIRGGFTLSRVVLQSLFQMSSALSHLGFLQSIRVPMAWQACGRCSWRQCSEPLFPCSCCCVC